MLAAAQCFVIGAAVLVWLWAPHQAGRYAAMFLCGFSVAHLIAWSAR